MVLFIPRGGQCDVKGRSSRLFHGKILKKGVTFPPIRPYWQQGICVMSRRLHAFLSVGLVVGLCMAARPALRAEETPVSVQAPVKHADITSKLGDSLFFTLSDGKLLAQWKGDA